MGDVFWLVGFLQWEPINPPLSSNSSSRVFFFFVAPGQFVDGDAVQRRFHYKSSQREGDVNEGFSFHEKIIDTQSRQLSVAVSQRVEKIYWVSGSFSALRREPLYKCRKWFTDVKWGTKQIGRSCQSDWDRGSFTKLPTEDTPSFIFPRATFGIAHVFVSQTVCHRTALWA